MPLIYQSICNQPIALSSCLTAYCTFGVLCGLPQPWLTASTGVELLQFVTDQDYHWPSLPLLNDPIDTIGQAHSSSWWEWASYKDTIDQLYHTINNSTTQSRSYIWYKWADCPNNWQAHENKTGLLRHWFIQKRHTRSHEILMFVCPKKSVVIPWHHKTSLLSLV